MRGSLRRSKRQPPCKDEIRTPKGKRGSLGLTDFSRTTTTSGTDNSLGEITAANTAENTANAAGEDESTHDTSSIDSTHVRKWRAAPSALSALLLEAAPDDAFDSEAESPVLHFSPRAWSSSHSEVSEAVETETCSVSTEKIVEEWELEIEDAVVMRPTVLAAHYGQVEESSRKQYHLRERKKRNIFGRP